MGASTASTVQGANQAASTAAGVGGAAAQAAGISSASLLGPVGIGLAVAGTTLSFIQASKQMKLQREAEASAAKALEEAKRQININPYAALGIQKEPYELEREALLSQGAQAIAAGQEADRGAAATAGRIYAGQVAAQQGQRVGMQKEMSDLEKLTAEEQANIKTQQANLSLAEAQGYQTQAKEAAIGRAKAIQEAYQSGATAIKGAAEELPTIIARGRRSDTSNEGQVSRTPAPQGPSGNQQVPSSKLNVSTFQTMPSWQSLAEQQMVQGAQYNQGSKLGMPIKTPNWSDVANYFNYFNQ